MFKLSSLQIAAMDKMRETHSGPLGFLMEDGQQAFPFITYITREVRKRFEHSDTSEYLRELEKAQVAKWIDLTGWPSSRDPVPLKDWLEEFQWVFLVFNGRYGRADIAEQLDDLLSQRSQLDGLFLINNHFDQAGAYQPAPDDQYYTDQLLLRRLFAMIPTTDLYFKQASHLAEIVEDDYPNSKGVLGAATLFAAIRAIEPESPYAANFRHFIRILKNLKDRTMPRDIVDAFRPYILNEDLLKIAPRFFPPSPGEFRKEVERIFEEFSKSYK